MKHTFKLSKIDCPNCANRMEIAVSKLLSLKALRYNL